MQNHRNIIIILIQDLILLYIFKSIVTIFFNSNSKEVCLSHNKFSPAKRSSKGLQDFVKTSLKHLQDVLKTSLRHLRKR